MKKLALSTIALVLISFGSFASIGTPTKLKTESEKSFMSKQISISNVKYNKKHLICSFTLTYNDGVHDSWSTQYDCTDMTWPDIDTFLRRVFFGIQ